MKFSNCMFDYEGELLAREGTKYPHGKGVLVMKDGKKLEGTFEYTKHPTQSAPTGNFLVTFPEGCENLDYLTSFEGRLVHGEKQGMVKMVYRDGIIYEGNYKDNCRHGLGKFYFPGSVPNHINTNRSNFVFEGHWRFCEPIGRCSLTWMNRGEKSEGSIVFEHKDMREVVKTGMSGVKDCFSIRNNLWDVIVVPISAYMMTEPEQFEKQDIVITFQDVGSSRGHIVSFKDVKYSWTVELEEEKTVCSRSSCSSVGTLRCSRCKQAFYCSRDCSVAVWSSHKEECTREKKLIRQKEKKNNKAKN